MGCVRGPGDGPMLRPGEVALRVRPTKRGEDWGAALDEVMQRARTGELLPGDIVGTADGDVRVGKPGDGLTPRTKGIIRQLQIEGLAPWD